MTPNEPGASDKSDNSKKAMMFVMDGVLGAAALVLVGVFAGNWLDEKLHSAPWWSLGLSMLGGGLGLWRLCVKAMALDTGGSGKKLTGAKKRGATSSLSGEETAAPSGEEVETGTTPGQRGADRGPYGQAVQDGGTSAPKAAYEHFTDITEENSD